MQCGRGGRELVNPLVSKGHFYYVPDNNWQIFKKMELRDKLTNRLYIFLFFGKAFSKWKHYSTGLHKVSSVAVFVYVCKRHAKSMQSLQSLQSACSFDSTILQIVGQYRMFNPSNLPFLCPSPIICPLLFSFPLLSTV